MRASAGFRLAAATALAALAVPAAAWGHAERPAFFPDSKEGAVPNYDAGTPDRVVCKPNSEQRIHEMVTNEARKSAALALLDDCSYEHIQQAVDAAGNEERIAVLPGVYTEEPSRNTTAVPERCSGMYSKAEAIPGTGIDLGDGEQVPNYDFHRTCRNVQNLIAIVGDKTTAEDPADTDRKCDDKCGLQIEGFGDSRDDVVIQGDKKKLNVIRADRADGVYLKNFTIEYSDFNNVYALETNGFRFDDIESRYSREYGFLSFTSDNGLYENLDAHHAGDSGVYPGSGPEYHCDGYGIEIRDVNSHHNTIGYSGTAGNGIWAHGNRFHDNAAGMTTDSFASGHPGMPQDCAKFEDNRVYSNNNNLFSDDRDRYCRETEYEERDPEKVCPTFQVPVGTGILVGGGNENTIGGNRIYDNWRYGTMLFWVPGELRGEPTKTFDTSWGNEQVGNTMGVAPTGRSDPNGLDFWWDEENGYEDQFSVPPLEGALNCWESNVGFRGKQPTSDPAALPDCPGAREFRLDNPDKTAANASCATWDPMENPDPFGCDWFTLPPEPGPKGSKKG